MTTTFGPTSTGFVRMTEQDIVDAIEADQLATIHDDLDFESDQILAQQNGVVARQLGIAWEALEVVNGASDPDDATGRLLEALSKLTGTFRIGNTASQVLLTCNLDIGTTLAPNVAYANVQDTPDILWTPVQSYTAAIAGDQPVAFQCESTGPIEALAGTLNVISAPVVGWNGVVNPDDAVLGKIVDTDAQLRTRREAEIATVGSASVRAITANVSQAYRTQLTSLTVFENENDVVDDSGVLPHSIETLIFDGDFPTIDNDALAQTILDSKAGGIQTTGNTTGFATGLVNGVTSLFPINFSRATQLSIYVTVTVRKGKNYVGDDEFKRILVETANAFFAPGDEVVAEKLKSIAIEDVGGVTDVFSLTLGLLAAPTGITNIPVTIREIGRFSTSRIVVVGA